MTGALMERLQFVAALDPVADGLAGTVVTPPIDVSGFRTVLFVVHRGVATGDVASSVFTVQACDDAVASNISAIPFYSRDIVAGDAEGELTARSSVGYLAPAGSSMLTLIEADVARLGESGWIYLRLKAVEHVDDPVVSSVLVIGERQGA